MKLQLIFEGDSRKVIVRSVEANATICTLGDTDHEVEQMGYLLREPLGIQKVKHLLQRDCGCSLFAELDGLNLLQSELFVII